MADSSRDLEPVRTRPTRLEVLGAMHPAVSVTLILSTTASAMAAVVAIVAIVATVTTAIVAVALSAAVISLAVVIIRR